MTHDYALDIVLFSVGELSACVINNIPLDHAFYIRNITNLPVAFTTFFALIFMFLVYCSFHALFHSPHMFIVCNSEPYVCYL